MDLITKPINVFVFGDLVLDSMISGTDKRPPYQAAIGEKVVDGELGINIAGGAANCARLIAALSLGRSCLWGLSGHSPRESFIDVMQHCHIRDGSNSQVIYYGPNKSHAMNTIIRLVRTDSHRVYHRDYRIDYIYHIPVTDSEIRDAIAYLRAEHEKHHVHAIIINDLDMKALNESLIMEIGNYAKDNKIPVFVDPKRDWKKYRSISVTCALPNLSEWCYIVDDAEKQSHWRDTFSISVDSLQKMAVKTLRYMPNADFHIIKCDSKGMVFIGNKQPGRRVIYHILPHPTLTSIPHNQIGTGDILVAALALEYAASPEISNNTNRMMTALIKANAIVACYLELDWQKVPNRREIKHFQVKKIPIVPKTDVMEGIIYLPMRNANVIHLSDHTMGDSKLVSIDKPYRDTVKELVDYLTTGWDKKDLRSAILTGRGGVGKTTLQDLIEKELAKYNISVWKDFKCSEKDCPTVNDAVTSIEQGWKKLTGETKGFVVVIDEAFTKAIHLTKKAKGKLLLQLASEKNRKTRFLFIEADYNKHKAELSSSQFLSRCKIFELNPIGKRIRDVPYIFAASCLKTLAMNGIENVLISEAVLLSIINWVLETPEKDQSIRLIEEKAEVIAKKALSMRSGDNKRIEISMRFLQVHMHKYRKQSDSPRVFFEFSWK